MLSIKSNEMSVLDVMSNAPVATSVCNSCHRLVLIELQPKTETFAQLSPVCWQTVNLLANIWGNAWCIYVTQQVMYSYRWYTHRVLLRSRLLTHFHYKPYTTSANIHRAKKLCIFISVKTSSNFNKIEEDLVGGWQSGWDCMVRKYFSPYLTNVTTLPCETQMFYIVT